MNDRHFDAQPNRQRRRLLDSLPVAAALLLVVAAGLAHGKVTGRWESNEELADAADRLSQIPNSFGDWSSSDVTKNSEELAVAEAAGYLCRHYRHARTGEEVTVLLLCGPPGPISVHPPTACYRARGYQLLSDPQLTELSSDERQDQFQLAEFQGQSTLTEDRVAIMWGWSVAGQWSAPDSPRFAFAGEPALYKLYVTWDRSHDQRPLEETLPRDFLSSFLSTIEQQIGSSSVRKLSDEAASLRD
jgi:hypothetical protein